MPDLQAVAATEADSFKQGVVIEDKSGEQVLGHAEDVQVDPFFDTAKSKGWKPLEEFDGDPDEWVDAKEFIKRSPLYDRLKQQGKKLKEQDKALHDMAGHIDKVAEASYKRAINDLQREKKEAISVADSDRVEEIDKEIDQIRGEMVPAKPAVPEVAPAIQEWIAKPENKWFNESKEMATFAVNYQQYLFSVDPTLDVEESLKKVEKAVKKEFPDKFTNPARSSAAAVETSVAAVSTGKKVFSFKDLNDEQRSVASRMERLGIMSKDEYVKQLADNGILGV